MENQKLNFTSLGNLPGFESIIKKLDLFEKLTLEEREYILTISIIAFDKYKNNSKLLEYLRFSYYIILHYTVITLDYKPLLDFSINLWLYPIAHKILTFSSWDDLSLIDWVIDKILKENFLSKTWYIQTFLQKRYTDLLLQSEERENAYIAPTSYGKSEIIIRLLKENNWKIVVIVPTKSLLIQTYKNICKENLNKKIILHDWMFSNETEFIAILTQERALRFIEKQNIPFDIIMIDEAHNILDDSLRSILLTRLIKKNYKLNNDQKVYYFSPLIVDVNNIKINNQIKDFQIKFDMKEPQLLEFRENQWEFLYNRYLWNFFETWIWGNTSWVEYIKQEAWNKNFIFDISPKKIESVAAQLTKILDIIQSRSLNKLKDNLKTHVHEDFEILDMLDYGVIYLHGQMPDVVKEYLEVKFKDNDNLKFLVANMVILEGINLPIDRLFINSSFQQDVKKIINLIGRVNRLNYIFLEGSFDIKKLLPKISFLKNKWKGVEALRAGSSKDKVINPTLNEYIEPKDYKKLEKNRLIKENENFILNEHSEIVEQIKSDIINLDINGYYKDINLLSLNIYWLSKNIDVVNFDNLLDEVYRVFFENEEWNINNYEVLRLINPESRNYYSKYLKNHIKKSLNEKIKSHLAYFIEKSNCIMKKDRLLYVWKTYWEEPWPDNSNWYNVYVDLRWKTKKDLVNLAISKINLEENFISYDLTKFIEFLYKNNFINNTTYNLFIYGTEDENLIKLTKTGLSMSLVQKLQDANQIQNLSFDNNGNLIWNELFYNYLNGLDDFEQFEINRYIFNYSQ